MMKAMAIILARARSSIWQGSPVSGPCHAPYREDRKTLAWPKRHPITSGVESFIALKDACRVDDETARQISAGPIDAMLDRALREVEDVSPGQT